MWITISSDHNPDSRLRPSATAVHNDGMNSKTKRKHTNGFNEDRLMLISWAAPVLSQLVMLVIMIAQRQWLYVAMLAPGLISSALSLASMALRSNQKQQHDEPVSTTYAKVVETGKAKQPFAVRRNAPYVFRAVLRSGRGRAALAHHHTNMAFLHIILPYRSHGAWLVSHGSATIRTACHGSRHHGFGKIGIAHQLVLVARHAIQP